LPGIAVLLKRR